MAKSKLPSRSAFFLTALALTRPAWATGLGGNRVDEDVPFFLYLFFLSLACYVSHRLLLQHERVRLLRSLHAQELLTPASCERERFFPVIQILVSLAAATALGAGVLPAVFVPILPFGYALGRRRNWAGLAFLVAMVVVSVPFFFVFMLLLLSI